MAEISRVETLYNKLKNVKEPSEINQVRSLIHTRIASGIEAGEEFSEQIHIAGQTWENVDAILTAIDEENDPNLTLNFAVDLILIPQGESATQENYHKWVRSNGLILLGSDDKNELIDEYLANGPKKNALHQALLNAMDTDMEPFTKDAGSFTNPLGFTGLQAIYVCLGLENSKNPLTTELFNHALKRSKDTIVRQALALEITDPPYAYLSERFPPN